MVDSVLIKGVELVTPHGVREGDILIIDGRISKVDWSLSDSAEFELKGKGLTLLPGAIDTHVHFREPGPTHKEDLASGSRAAASGGVTTFFDMPNNAPNCTTIDAMTDKKARAAKSCVTNYNFYIGATVDNLDVLNSVENVPAIKVFMASSTGNLLVDKHDDIERIFATGSRLIALHSEDEDMINEGYETYSESSDVSDHTRRRCPEAALKATQFVVEMANKYKRRAHILHLGTEEEVRFLSKQPSPYVTAEVCIQNLLLTAPEIYNQIGTFAQMNPPIREKHHQEALWLALQSGLISQIVTDHAPHLIAEKALPFGQSPCGLPGVETVVPLTLNAVNQGRLSLEHAVRLLSSNAARNFRIQNKGAIAPGYDADFMLVDMKGRKTIRNQDQFTKCGWSAFDGWDIQGVPLMTFVNGQMVYREGDITATEPVGCEVIIN